MTRRRATRLPWAVCTLIGLVLGAAVAMGVANGSDALQTLGFAPTVVAFSVVGALIASRHSRNSIGWLFQAFALLTALVVAQQQYIELALVTSPRPLPAGDWVAWAFTWSLELAFAPLIVAFLLFPHGRPPAPLWRHLIHAAVALTAVGVGVSLLAAPNLEPNFPFAESPVELIPLTTAEDVYDVYQWLVLVLLLASAASVIARLWTASGAEREQVKWFTYAVTATAFSQLLAALLLDETVVAAIFTFPLIPAAVGIAILKYRLYDIDVLINRTLVYGVLTATLALAYFGAVVLLQQLFAPITPDSDLAIAGSTLTVAALFRPARARIQSFIDRRFYRRKYDAAATLEAFSTKLRDEIDLEMLTGELITVVTQTMQPVHASLWLPNVGERRGLRPGRTA